MAKRRKKTPNCKGCGMCCIFAGFVYASPELAKLEPKVKERGKWTGWDWNLSVGKQHGETRNGNPHCECVFLTTRRTCSIYANRPGCCSSFRPGGFDCVEALDRAHRHGFKKGVRNSRWD